jgi:branched-chain amino acid transport system permease protein
MTAVAVEVSTLILIYAVILVGLNLVVGYGRIFSVNQALLFGVGAFAYAGATHFLGTNELLVSWAIAIVAASLLSMIVAMATLRVSGDHFIIASFGIQLAVLQVFYNWSDLSGGAAGAFGLPNPTLLGVEFNSPSLLLGLAFLTAVAAIFLALLVVRSPYGRLIKAIADDEIAVTAAGFEVLPIKVGVFVLGGSLAAIAGVVYASYLGVAQVSDYSITVSITLLAAVVAGGLRSVPGSILGALLFVGLPNALNLLHVPVSISGPLQQLVFGVLLVTVMMFLPGGMAGIVALARGARLFRRRSSADGQKSLSA